MDLVINLPCFDIVVILSGPQGARTGTIKSDLTSEWSGSGPGGEYDYAIEGIESLILAHACAGVNIADPAYVEGIEAAVQAVGNIFA